jgi:threonine/homoserine/homoserine lactone efflux protein
VLTTLPQTVLDGLQIAGALFLIYLAYGAYRNFQTATTTEASAEIPARQSLLKGALVNFLSPNPYIFWATIAGPILLNAWRETLIYGLVFLLGFYVSLIGGFLLFVAIFALTGKIDRRVNRALGLISAIALFLFGLYQLGQGILKFINA